MGVQCENMSAKNTVQLSTYLWCGEPIFTSCGHSHTETTLRCHELSTTNDLLIIFLHRLFLSLSPTLKLKILLLHHRLSSYSQTILISQPELRRTWLYCLDTPLTKLFSTCPIDSRSQWKIFFAYTPRWTRRSGRMVLIFSPVWIYFISSIAYSVCLESMKFLEMFMARIGTNLKPTSRMVYNTRSLAFSDIRFSAGFNLIFNYNSMNLESLFWIVDHDLSRVEYIWGIK